MFVVCVHAAVSPGLPRSAVFKKEKKNNADKCGQRAMLWCVEQLEGELRKRVPPERRCLGVFSWGETR